MAGRLNTDWFVVYVETPGEAPDADRRRGAAPPARQHREGARARRRGRAAAARATRWRRSLDFARSHGVGHIIIGRSHQPWWRQLLGRSVPMRLRARGQRASTCTSSRSRRRTGDRDPAREAPARAGAAARSRWSSSASVGQPRPRRRSGASAQAILRDNYRSVLAAQRMKEAIERIDSGALFCVAGEREAGLAEIADARGAFESELRVQEGNITEPGEGEATARLRVAWRDYRGALERFTATSDAAERRRALLRRAAAGASRHVKRNAEAVLALNQDAMVRKSDAAQHAAQRLNTLLLAAAALGCLVGVLSSGLLTARILRPLAVLGQAARRLGEGDAAARARVVGRDEIAQLAGEFNTMADRLAELPRELARRAARRRSARRRRRSTACPIRCSCSASTGEILHLNRAAETLLALRPQTGLAERRPGAARGARARARARARRQGRLRAEGLRGGGARREPRRRAAASCRAATPVYAEEGGGDRRARSCSRT